MNTCIAHPLRIAAALSAALFLAPSAAPATELPGRHGFDFMLGSWKSHFRLLRHPLTGSKEWIAFDGTIVDRSILGFVNMDEGVLFRTSGPEHSITVRVYNQKADEWSIYFGTDAGGALALPATVGKFDEHDVGRFYDREPYHGKPIVVRYLWTHSSPNECHYEQAFSSDNGKTWETNWISDMTRVSQASR
jgi:hypothetical protein